MTKSRALWHTSSTTSEVRETPSPRLVPGYCVVQSLYSLISTGTERLVATGHVPLSLHDDMAVPHMEGSFSFPVKYGYSLVGRVTQGSAELEGRLVHLLHPHQSHCLVQETDIFPVPDSVPPLRATLASNLETALTALWDAEVAIGDSVLVVGFGMIGALVARLLQALPAVTLFVCDTNAERLAIAEQAGFTVAPPEMHDVDVAFHSSGSEAGLQTSIDAVGHEGRVVELSWYGTRPVRVHLGESFHRQRKQLISSQVASLPARRSARWDFRRRKKVVFELLKNEAFDQHITEVIALENLPSLFDRIRQGDRSELGWGVKY